MSLICASSWIGEFTYLQRSESFENSNGIVILFDNINGTQGTSRIVGSVILKYRRITDQKIKPTVPKISSIFCVTDV